MPKRRKGTSQFKIFDQNHATFLLIDAIWSKKRRVFYIERHKTLFLGQMCLERNNEEIYDF